MYKSWIFKIRVHMPGTYSSMLISNVRDFKSQGDTENYHHDFHCSILSSNMVPVCQSPLTIPRMLSWTSLACKGAEMTNTFTIYILGFTIYSNCFNPLAAKVFNLNFYPLEVVFRWRDPQLQVSENYSNLTK